MQCEHVKSKVIETRRVGPKTYRRRCCDGCGMRFVTEEQPTGSMPVETHRHHRQKNREALLRAQAEERAGRFEARALVAIWK